MIPLEAVLALLIDRAGGVIALSDEDVRRIAEMKPYLQFTSVNDFSGDAIRIRYENRVTIPGAAK